MVRERVQFFERYTENQSGRELFHQCWYPVARSEAVAAGGLTGVDFLGTKVIVYRDASLRPVVQEAWCPHLGADLSGGTHIDGSVRCPYHHWRFNAAGICVDIPSGGKIPPGAKIFTFPSAEAWGLIWAFNGEGPLYEVPKIPGAEEDELFYTVHLRNPRQAPAWLSTSNGVDFQHVRSLHNLPAVIPDEIEIGDYRIEYRIDTPYVLHHGLISGTNVFAQHLRVQGSEQFMLFAGAPIDMRATASFFVVGIRKPEPGSAAERAAGSRLEELQSFVQRVTAEDDSVLNRMRFRRGVLTAADRHLARYFKYVEAYPLAERR